MGVHGLLLADFLVALFVIAVALRPPMVVRRRWTHQSPRIALVGGVFAAASPLL